LQHISGWVDRAVLFVVKGEQATGWAAFGLGSDWDVSRVRKIAVDLNKDTVLHHAVQSGEAAYGSADEFPDNGDLFTLIGSASPQAALAFPIQVRGKIAGVLYADTAGDIATKPDLPNLLFLACHAAGSAIDLLPTRPKGAAAPAPPKPVAQTEAAPTVILQNPVQVAAAPQSVSHTIPSVSTPEEQDLGTVIMPAMRPAVITEEDQKLHEDAKRFARLLVSEIKLYNEAQVSAGREHKDLYERLKDDIERSRKMYQDRVPSNIQSASNYFYEELVRTLANGDPSLLGM
jgi:hypothetical protein